MAKSNAGRFFHTTTRVFRNHRLVVGAEQDIPWQQAIDLGLVEDDSVKIPVVLEPTPEQLAATLIEIPEGENAPTLVETTEVAASIRKRSKKNPSGKLSNVS